MQANSTLIQHAEVIRTAKEIFLAKSNLYGDTLQVMDVGYITDRMMVKCERIVHLIGGRQQQVAEGIDTELKDIINYAVIALAKVKRLVPKQRTLQALEKCYDDRIREVTDLFKKKNNDYNDAWRRMRYLSLITQIQVKLLRIQNSTQQVSALATISHSVVDQLQDIINYAVFALLHPSVEKATIL